MNFAQYLGGGGDTGPGGDVVDRGDVFCFEDGSCVDRSGMPIGRPHDPKGVRTPPNVHMIYGDGTGGPFVFGRERRVSPQPRTEGDGTGGPAAQGSLGSAAEFALLLEALKRRRG